MISNDLPIIHPDKCCVECKYMYIDTGERGYSDLNTMECTKLRWEYERHGWEEDYRDCILSAKRCTDFVERDKGT